MNLSQLQQFLLWCTIINYVLLILWWVILILPHEWIYNLSGKPLKLSPEEFDKYNFTVIIFYKLGIILLFLVPYIALRIIA